MAIWQDEAEATRQSCLYYREATAASDVVLMKRLHLYLGCGRWNARCHPVRTHAQMYFDAIFAHVLYYLHCSVLQALIWTPLFEVSALMSHTCICKRKKNCSLYNSVKTREYSKKTTRTLLYCRGTRRTIHRYTLRQRKQRGYRCRS